MMSSTSVLFPEPLTPVTQVIRLIGMRASNGVFVMLNHEHGISEIAQAGEGGQEAIVVALMQADARFVENVEDADQARADLRGEANALGFAAAERAAFAIQREIAETD